jgi:deferrochelatase/peroxidase EfeB
MAARELEVHDIQAGVLRPRPTPYAATYLLLRVDDRKAGRELMRRLRAIVASAANPASPAADASVAVALTYQGLKALGVPQASLDSFAPEFQQGMAARAKFLHDEGESGPENWEKPLGSPDVHVVIAAISPDTERLEAAVARARKVYLELKGVTAIWRQDCHVLPDEKEAFGFKDGIGHPAIEGSGIPGSNPTRLP